MTKKKRYAAGMLCVCLLLALALAVSFLETEAGHVCSGAGCPVCSELSACTALLKNWDAVRNRSLLFVQRFLCAVCAGSALYMALPCQTLITQKVKLSD